MGKRSNFERIPRDFYPTPHAAVPPLIPHLRGVRTFAEPCCGDGALVRHLESFGLRCAMRATSRPARTPWRSTSTARPTRSSQTRRTAQNHARPDRALPAHPADVAVNRLDWACTKQAAPFMPSCSDIVSVGRLRWIEGTTMSGKQNLHGTDSTLATRPARSSMRMGRRRWRRAAACARNAASHIGRSDRTPGSARTPVGNAPIAND